MSRAQYNLDKRLERIAKVHLGTETLKTRGSDRLDFHEVGVASLKAALEEAYFAGQESGLSLGAMADR